ncbi:MAG: hypothetical protein ACXV76_11555 [Halobacteriota archaeon]
MKIIETLRDWSTPTEQDVLSVRVMGAGARGLLLFRFTLGGLIFATAVIFFMLFILTLDFKYLLIFPLLLVYGGRRSLQLVRFIKAHKLSRTALS